MKIRGVLIGLGLGLIACSDGAPTAVTQPFSPFAKLPPEIVAAQAVLADARDRLVPALWDQELADGVDRAFAAGTAYLAMGDREAFRGAMDRARAALAVYLAAPARGASSTADGDVEPDDAPILESLALVIDLIEAAVLGEGTVS
jgi:hypothetical protein